jgi:uncharacterized protein YjiS (DUF1127 family)
MSNACETARPTRVPNTAPWNRAMALPRRLLEALIRRGRMRRDEAFLLSQPDYMLRDIGIGRSEIYAAIHSRAQSRTEREGDISETGYGTRR